MHCDIIVELISVWIITCYYLVDNQVPVVGCHLLVVVVVDYHSLVLSGQSITRGGSLPVCLFACIPGLAAIGCGWLGLAVIGCGWLCT